MSILDGTKIAQEMKMRVKQEILHLKAKYGAAGLAVIRVGEDPASKIYVGAKRKACEAVGIVFHEVHLPQQTSESVLQDAVKQLNQNPEIHGILIQLPLPNHINASTLLNRIDPQKDVDGFHPMNVGKLFLGEKALMPCTPGGIITLLKAYHIGLEGQNCVIVGRSNIVGKPLGLMLLAHDATVTFCHSKTKDLAQICSQADILIVAIGKPEFITGEFIKKDAVVLDVGVNRLSGKKVVGDVKYEEAITKCSWLSPVPGGVGPMTIATLLENTLMAYKMQKSN